MLAWTMYYNSECFTIIIIIIRVESFPSETLYFSEHSSVCRLFASQPGPSVPGAEV